MGDKQLHSYAGYHQENLECGSDHRCNYMAIERLRTHWKHLVDPRWEVREVKIPSIKLSENRAVVFEN